MIYGTRLVGEELLKIQLVEEFRKQYHEFRTSQDPLLQEFFQLNESLSLQFDGLVGLFTYLINKKPSEVKKINDFEDFIYGKCFRLAIISNLITHILNNFIINDEVLSVLNLPYDNHFDKDSVKDDAKLKHAFQVILQEEEDVDDLFSLIVNLRNKFFSSNLFKQYLKALKTDGGIEKFEIDVQALFYLIKQIIYQQIRDGCIKSINEENIIKFDQNSSLEGRFFKITYQPSNNLNFSTGNEVIEIIFEDKTELGVITHLNMKFSQDKGYVIKIKGEILSNNGFNINSPSNSEIDQLLDKIGHWYGFTGNILY